MKPYIEFPAFDFDRKARDGRGAYFVSGIVQLEPELITGLADTSLNELPACRVFGRNGDTICHVSASVREVRAAMALAMTEDSGLAATEVPS